MLANQMLGVGREEGAGGGNQGESEGMFKAPAVAAVAHLCRL